MAKPTALMVPLGMTKESTWTSTPKARARLAEGIYRRRRINTKTRQRSSLLIGNDKGEHVDQHTKDQGQVGWGI